MASTGISQAEGERLYRDVLKGRIGSAAWREVYKAAFQIVGWREDIRSIPSKWSIPKHMFVQTGTDWGQRYNFIAEVEVWSNEEQRWTTKYAQAQSDKLLEAGEWRKAIEEALEKTSPPGVHDVTKGIRFLKAEATRWARD